MTTPTAPTVATVATYRVSARTYRKESFPERKGLSLEAMRARVQRLRAETACTEYRVFEERGNRDRMIESWERKNGEWVKRAIPTTVIPFKEV